MALISYATRSLDNRAETLLSFPSSVLPFSSKHYSEFLKKKKKTSTGAGNIASGLLLCMLKGILNNINNNKSTMLYIINYNNTIYQRNIISLHKRCLAIA